MANSASPRSDGGLLLAGALALIVGLALVGTSHPTFGGALVAGGWVALGAAIHRLGRAG